MGPNGNDIWTTDIRMYHDRYKLCPVDQLYSNLNAPNNYTSVPVAFYISYRYMHLKYFRPLLYTWMMYTSHEI